MKQDENDPYTRYHLRNKIVIILYTYKLDQNDFLNSHVFIQSKHTSSITEFIEALSPFHWQQYFLI